MNSPIIFNTNQLAILNTLYANYIINQFNDTNTASGTTSVTINGRSGVATFTQTISAGSKVNYSISNSSVTSSTKLNLSLDADFGSTTGLLDLMGYNCTNGAIDLFFYNPEVSNDFDVDISVSFQVLN